MAGYFRAKQPMAASEIMSKVIVQRDAIEPMQQKFCKNMQRCNATEKTCLAEKGEQMEITSTMYKRGKELLYVTLMQG